MARPRSLIGLLALIAVACLAGRWLMGYTRPNRPALEVTTAYLLVSVEGPPEWGEQHHPTIRWNGKDVPLPVVFRVKPHDANRPYPEWGAAAEYMHALKLGPVTVPIRVDPPTGYRVSNEPVAGLIPEPGRQSGVASFAVAGWVTVGPKDRPGISPPGAADAMKTRGPDVANRVAGLVAANRVIDVDFGPDGQPR